MGSRAALAAVLLLGACGGHDASHSPRMRLTPKDIVQQSSDGVVRVQSGTNKVGTGFILDKQGLLATNLHVVVGEKDVKVKLHDGTVLDVIAVAGYDMVHDLAVLRIKPPKQLNALRLGDSQQITAGDPVTAIGNPLGVFDYSVTNGLVSAVRDLCAEARAEGRNPDCPQGGLTVLQISVPISQGSSGGPLFNQYGEVVGVTTAIITAGQAINLAMPANYLKPMIANPGAQAMAAFATETAKLEREAEGEGGGDEDNSPVPDRRVPVHALSVLDGCSDQQVKEMIQSIGAAIDIGAPLYNQRSAKGMEACFRVYEGTATKLEQTPPCPGVGKAFGEGLLRASTLSTYKEKAWAMRDTFDGLTAVGFKRLGIKP